MRTTHVVVVAITALVLCLAGVLGQQDANGGAVQLSIEHAIGAGAPFTPRGQVALPPLQQTGALYAARNQPRVTQPDLSPADLRTLKVPRPYIFLQI
jgi:hypothetical protein